MHPSTPWSFSRRYPYRLARAAVDECDPSTLVFIIYNIMTLYQRGQKTEVW